MFSLSVPIFTYSVPFFPDILPMIWILVPLLSVRHANSLPMHNCSCTLGTTKCTGSNWCVGRVCQRRWLVSGSVRNGSCRWQDRCIPEPHISATNNELDPSFAVWLNHTLLMHPDEQTRGTVLEAYVHCSGLDFCTERYQAKELFNVNKCFPAFSQAWIINTEYTALSEQAPKGIPQFN